MEHILKVCMLLDPIFNQLMYMSIVAILIGIIIVVIKIVFKKMISPKWISRIWLIFIFSLIIPIFIKSGMSIYNIIPVKVEEIKNENYIVEKFNKEYKIDYQIQTEEEKNFIIDIKDIILILWLISMVSTFLIYVFTYIILEIKIKKSFNKQKDILKKNDLNDILKKNKEILKVRKNIKIVIQDYIKMPSIYGIFDVKILLNDNIKKLTKEEVNYIILHELAHYKRKDNLLNVVCSIFKCIYIFNPIVIFFIEQLKNDMEIATDELALNLEDMESKKKYCRTLVKISNVEFDNFIVRTVCLSNNKKNLNRRINMIKMFEKFKNNKILTVFSFFIIVCIIIIFGTRGTNYMSRKDIINLLQKGSNIDNVYCQTITNNEITKIYIKSNILYSVSESNNNIYLITWENLNTKERIVIDLIEKKVSNESIYELSTVNNRFKGLFNENSLYKYKFIEKTIINEKNAYKVQLSKESPYQEINERIYFYIDINTGVILQLEFCAKSNEKIISNEVLNFEYIYNIVTDTEIQKPEISTYFDF